MRHIAMRCIVLLCMAILAGCATTAPTPDVKINQSQAGMPANEEPTVTCDPNDANACIAGFHERFELSSTLSSRIITARTQDGGATWGNGQAIAIPCQSGAVSTTFDPWLHAPERTASRIVFNIAYIGQCRSSITSEIIGFSRAAYRTSSDKGTTWSSAQIISPDTGNADKTHVFSTEKGAYISYVFFGAGEVRVHSAILQSERTLGFGAAPVTVEINADPPTTITAFITPLPLVGNMLKVAKTEWKNPARQPENPVSLRVIRNYQGTQKACSGAEFTVPGTRIRHFNIPQITTGGSPLQVYIAIDNFNSLSQQFELEIWRFPAASDPASGTLSVYNLPGKNIIFPTLTHNGTHLVATFYAQDSAQPYYWDFMQMTMDDTAQRVGDVARLNTPSPLNFFGTEFVGDYMGIAPRANGKFYTVWTDPRNHSALSECPGISSVGTDIYGRDN